VPARIHKLVYSTTAPVCQSDPIEKQWEDTQAWIAAGKPARLIDTSGDNLFEEDFSDGLAEDLSLLDDLVGGEVDADRFYVGPSKATDRQPVVATSASPEIVNSPKEKRRVSIFRDALFMQQLQASLARSDAGTSDATLVSRLPLLVHPLNSSIFNRASKHEPWWTRLNSGKPLPKPARQFRAPAEWRDVSDTLHVHYLHLALTTLGPVYAFTSRLSDSVEARARVEPNALSWLTARITQRLRTVLGQSVQFYCVLEQDETKRLHLHGEFTLGSDNDDGGNMKVRRRLVLVRKALRLAGGEWKKSRQFQAKVRANPDAGWAGYISKDSHLYGSIVRPYLKLVGSQYAPSFEGNQITRTALLGKAAAKVYAQHRELVLTT
jgi:hypothetical protein